MALVDVVKRRGVGGFWFEAYTYAKARLARCNLTCQISLKASKDAPQTSSFRRAKHRYSWHHRHLQAVHSATTLGASYAQISAPPRISLAYGAHAPGAISLPALHIDLRVCRQRPHPALADSLRARLFSTTATAGRKAIMNSNNSLNMLQEVLWHEPEPSAEQQETKPNLIDYDRIIVAFSGGKDSVAAVLHLIDLGVEPSRIELHHHLVDGPDSDLMDWPVTEAYCNALAKALNVRISYSWKVGGFEREMLREESPTAPTNVPCGGSRKLVGGEGKNGTRKKFPQVSASLTTRWCSAYMKIGVMDSWVVNDPLFVEGKTLVVTGERGQESASRAKYKTFEPHRADNRLGARVKRYVDHWRPVHKWLEQDVWAIMKRFGIVAHPAYFLGWGRCSCRVCIFGSKDQWATVKLIAPAQFKAVSAHEKAFGVTIHRTESVEQRAASGTPYATDPFWVAIANSREWTIPIITDNWVLPAGAYGDQCGPT